MKNIKYFLTVEEYSNKEIEYPNISYIKDMKNGYIEPKPIIMTSESNPAAMSICYNQGWAKNPDYMTKYEAEAVTDIGMAFNGMSSYVLLSFNEFKYFINVTSIGNTTFAQCSLLSEITIPSGITSIGDFAFGACYSLTSITIPNSVTSISNSAFVDCYFTSDSFINNSSLDAEANGYWGAMIDDNITEDGLCIINNEIIFSRKSLTSITIPNSVTSIGTDVFGNCYLLKSVIFEEESKLTSIGNYAFANCDSLSSITIPDSVTSIGNNAFYNCISLTSITIPESVTSINKNAFSSCYFTSDSFINNSSLDAEANGYWGATIVDEITEDGLCIINNEIIFSRRSLTSITIPNSVTSIGNSAFNYCESLKSVIFEEESKLISIGNNAFSYCRLLISITLPNSVELIGEQAFNSCESLKSVIFEEGSKLTSIGGYAFQYCYSLTSITIPNSVTSIGNSAFGQCYFTSDSFINNSSLDAEANGYWGATIVDEITENGLYIINNEIISCEKTSTNITILESVTSIGEYAFQGCTSLRSITIPNSVESIGNSAFNFCPSLKSVIFEEGSNLTSIGNEAFYGCQSLTSITIPNSVTSIGNEAFAYCNSLSEITCLAETAPTVSSNTFTSVSSLGIVYYPSLNSSYDTWKQYLPNWDFIQL